MRTKYPITREIERETMQQCTTITALFDMGDYDEVGIVQINEQQAVIFQYYFDTGETL